MFGIDLAALIETTGYVGLFVIIFAESGLIIGFFLPGASLLFTAGLLASQGYLNIWYLAPLLGFAAILGDNVGYWFGAKVGPRIFTREDSFFFHKKHIDRTREFFAKYGSKTILLARFVPFVRTFAPILAGVGSMHYPTFVFYNIAGALLWASGITTFGYVVGSTFPWAEEYLELIILCIILVTFSPLMREAWREWRAKKALQKPVKAVMFDLDDTLADAKQAIPPDIAQRLTRLLEVMPVGITSGGKWEQFAMQVLQRLPSRANLKHLHIMPTNAAAAYAFDGNSWHKEYDHSFTPEERARIITEIERALAETGVVAGEPSWGERIEDRGAQITFSALGQTAPLSAKRAWDPSREKRQRLRELLAPRLPEFLVRIGGTTSIDITRQGIDKAVGVNWMAKRFGIAPEEMLYVGDALFEGGNDTAVIPTGIRTRQVKNYHDTARVIDEILTFHAPVSPR